MVNVVFRFPDLFVWWTFLSSHPYLNKTASKNSRLVNQNLSCFNGKDDNHIEAPSDVAISLTFHCAGVILLWKFLRRLSWKSLEDLNFSCLQLLFSELALLPSFLFFIWSSKFFFVSFDVWYYMSDIDITFVITIPRILAGKDKSWRSSSLHVVPLNRDVIQIGCSRWMVLAMVRIMKLNLCLKPDLNVQYVACDRLLSWTHISFWPPPYQRLLQGVLPSLVIFKFLSLNIPFAVSYFSGFLISHDLLAFGKYPIFGPKAFSLFHQVSIFLYFPTQLISSAYAACFVLPAVVIFNNGRDTNPQIGIAVGSSCAVSSADVLSSPPDLKSLASRLFQFMTYVQHNVAVYLVQCIFCVYQQNFIAIIITKHWS